MDGSLPSKIKALKSAKNAVILAHYYQESNIQEAADFVGDSLELARKAAKTDANIIVFAGVYFMAETAKILNPTKKVLLPDLAAGCSLADNCEVEPMKKLIQKHPDALVVSYINCSAEIKALSDYVCTSSNALEIIQSIPKGRQIIFAPDKNLGHYLMLKSDRNLILWEGSCVVHEAFSMEKLIRLKKKYPEAQIIAHPESEPNFLKFAHFVGSTAKMIRYVGEHAAETFIVATEAGILHEMQKKVSEKILIPAPAKEDNSCACSECAYMKVNTLEKLYRCLIDESPEIILDENLRQEASKPIYRMLEFD